jgi:TonB-linked outer membrane protein, SusC/RagA family
MSKFVSIVRLAGLLCFSLACNSMFAQQQPDASGAVTVTGTITDEQTNEPLPGVTVQVKGQQDFVVTDTKGAFSIKVSGPRDILVFTSAGYTLKEVKVGNQTQMAIGMAPKRTGLNEVVVVGYGKQKRGEVTGSIASVKHEDFVKGFARDAAHLIQGKVAGLAVVTPSGNPNSTTQISLRGITTIMSTTQPLVLIDGIPGALNTVAPEDIETIDVLKDGSAAAIYGTRGTNGVVLITTRKRQGNMPASIAYDGYLSYQTIARKMEFLDAGDYRRLIAESVNFKDEGGSTDWLDAISRNPVSHTHNVTLQGGSGQTNYIASVNYRNWQGLFKRSNNEQVTGRLDINHSMFDNKLKININVIGRNRNYFSGPNYDYIYRQAIIRNPTDSIYNYQGNWKEDPSGYFYDNPLRPIVETDGETRVTELRTNATVMYSPLRNLNIKTLLSGIKSNTLTGYAESFEHRASVQNNRTGYASRSTSLFQDKMLEFTTDYTKTAGRHRTTLLGGYSYQTVTNEGFNAFNSNFPTELYSYNRLESGDALLFQNAAAGMGSYKNNFKLIGFFGRLNYGWDDKYLLMASMRREGSSKFGANYKWGTFPAVSLGWGITKERFMQPVGFVNDLKLRAGFGVTGTAPTDPYQSLISLNYGDRFLYNGVWIQQIAPVRNSNPNLRWEKKEEYNIGLDFSILGNRVSGSLDLYQRETKDMLYNFPVPVPPFLYSSILANAGRMRNKGVELLVNYLTIQSKDVTFSNNFTFSANKNTLAAISNDQFKTTNDFFYAGHTGEPIQEATHRVEVGEAIGNFWGYKSIDIDDNGRWIIESKDGKPIPIAQSSPEDKQVLGNGIPKYNASWNIFLRYKKLDLAINMRGAFGYQILNFQRLYYENPKIVQYNMLKTAFDNVYGKRRLDNDLAYVSYYIEDGDHWKIDNVTIGYTLPMAGTKYFKNARVYVSGLNLVVITGYKGIDPEVSRTGLDPGNDSRDKYPTTRTFTVGANFTF